MLSRWMALAPCLCLLGCTEPTQVLVEIDGDELVWDAMQSLRVTVWPRDSDGVESATTVEDTEHVADGLSRPFLVPLAPRNGDASRGYRVEAVATLSGGRTVTARVISGYQPNATRVVRVFLDAECVGAAECPTAEQTCRDGVCVDADIPPDMLCGLDESCDAGPDAGHDALDGGDAGDGPCSFDESRISDNFCPASALRRDQLAVMLVRLAHGGDFVPPPATGRFADVPASAPKAPFIEQLVRDGVTSGCGDGTNFCPADLVQRGVGAVFLVRADRGGGYVPPRATGRFSDVPTSDWRADFIEELARGGITMGCTASLFCPDNNLTREQMAVWLVRVKHGSAFVPPPAVGYFDDVPSSSTNAPYIEQLARDGITLGC